MQLVNKEHTYLLINKCNWSINNMLTYFKLLINYWSMSNKEKYVIAQRKVVERLTSQTFAHRKYCLRKVVCKHGSRMYLYSI